MLIETSRNAFENLRRDQPFMPNQTQRFVLLDRDGVINRRIVGGYVTSWGEFEFLPGALDGLRMLAENGYAALVISNQACVGKKLLNVAQLETITQRFLTEVALAGGNIRQVYYCVHEESDRCSCRKPQPGAILRAQLDYAFDPQCTYFVGDAATDLQAAASAGCPGILVRRDAFLESPLSRQSGPLVASNLYEAVIMIIAGRALNDTWSEAAPASTMPCALIH
jgi:D-glycero-D-manno-heptose 1,7-bisphosphate phosphatase